MFVFNNNNAVFVIEKADKEMMKKRLLFLWE